MFSFIEGTGPGELTRERLELILWSEPSVSNERDLVFFIFLDYDYSFDVTLILIAYKENKQNSKNQINAISFNFFLKTLIIGLNSPAGEAFAGLGN